MPSGDSRMACSPSGPHRGHADQAAVVAEGQGGEDGVGGAPGLAGIGLAAARGDGVGVTGYRGQSWQVRAGSEREEQERDECGASHHLPWHLEPRVRNVRVVARILERDVGDAFGATHRYRWR